MQRVREAADLVALVSRRVSLKRVGNRHVGLCPFHTEKTPSFSVSGSDGLYHCFGCKASGDAITFLRETEQLEFVEAVEQLAAAANITLTYDTPGAQRAQKRRAALLELLERAASYYHELLMSSSDAKVARGYLRRRGYDRETVMKWRLGFAPPQWDSPQSDALCRHLDAPAAQIAAAGLAYVKTEPTQTAPQEAESASGYEADSAVDFFRDRIMFPISDARGRVVSFAGRVVPRPQEPPAKGPKYKNTAGTSVYDKSRVLYGLHLAKQAARDAGRIVVCEGYTDVIGCDLVGVGEAVATCGTALTAQHAELLSRSAKHIVLAFDADAAGKTATERVHQWESTYGLSVSVAILPPESDPGDLAASNPPALRKAIEAAQPLHAFRAERVLDHAELDSPAGRDRAAEEAAEVLAVYPPDVLLDRDLAPIASRIPMEVEQFRARVDAARSRLAQGGTHRAASTRAGSRRDESADWDYAENSHSDEDVPPGYDESDSWSAQVTGEAEVEAAYSQRRSPQHRSDDVRKQVEADRALLEAAAAPEGNAIDLMVPHLLATPAGRAALALMRTETNWRARIAAHVNSDVNDAAAQPEDPVVALLAKAVTAGAAVSAEEAKDRVATAMLRFVRAAKRRVSSQENAPWMQLDSELSAAEQLGVRQELLRQLRSRERDLLDSASRIAAVQDLRDWLCSLGDPAKDSPADAPGVGLEPTTNGLTVRCSAN